MNLWENLKYILDKKEKLWNENKANLYESEKKLRLDDRDELQYERQQEVSNFSRHERQVENDNNYDYEYNQQPNDDYLRGSYNPYERVRLSNIICIRTTMTKRITNTQICHQTENPQRTLQE